MKIRFLSFNIYLLLAALLFSSGCYSPEEKEKREMSTIRMFLESNNDGTEHTGPVYVTSKKYEVNIDKEPFVTEGDVDHAQVVDGIGGFEIQVSFNAHGTLMLEMVTTSNKGKRMVIMTQSPQTKWIASPMIQKKIASGTLVFTPDCTRQEADRIVSGLNNVAKKIKRMDSLF
jgi:preprotein translocase subunit SecD